MIYAAAMGAYLYPIRCALSVVGKSIEETHDVWKLAAITSFSVLAVVLVGAALIIGVMVHRRKSHKRPLRGENEHCVTNKTAERMSEASDSR